MRRLILCIVFFSVTVTHVILADEKQTIKAIYIPLADHYAGIVAYEKYRDKMQKADYVIKRMKSWPLLRAHFMSGEADLAYIICPSVPVKDNEKTIGVLVLGIRNIN